MSKIDFNRIIPIDFIVGEIIETQDNQGRWFDAKVLEVLNNEGQCKLILEADKDNPYVDIHFIAPMNECRKK